VEFISAIERELKTVFNWLITQKRGHISDDNREEEEISVSSPLTRNLATCPRVAQDAQIAENRQRRGNER